MIRKKNYCFLKIGCTTDIKLFDELVLLMMQLYLEIWSTMKTGEQRDVYLSQVRRRWS